ncbi:small subunit of phage terminase [Paenibacillus sp. 32O-W]|uniref:phage terminase small subunit n=1 Tax=Paenibacillus sp. 32O-W TaxID=1695218 RepID=UPI000722F30E|nr:phage terminase small subunit [Paenibacillus sp. 32O-W]ALS27182.1 small subunit of phage terminase [Paenibacillus sp. 32O-W]
MAPKRSPLERKAFKMWCAAGRPRSTKFIADKLGISPEMVRKWKHYYEWESREDPRPGAPKGNKNAKGNKGGAPPGNANAVKHGLFRKFMPQDEEFQEIMDLAAEMDPLDMIWQNIVTQFTAIIRAPAIMHVTGKDEMIKELKKQKFEVHSKGRGKDRELIPVPIEVEYEFQWAWDRYATYLKAQSAAMTALNSSIRQFLNAAPENDERRAKLELMQAQVEKVKAEAKATNGPNEDVGDDGFLDALKGKAAEVWGDGEPNDEEA